MPLAKDSWLSVLAKPTACIEDAIKILDKTGLQIVLVVSPSNKLLGTITDGDIRRALLRGYELKSTLNLIAHERALVAPVGIDDTSALQMMLVNKVKQLPIVDDCRTVVGLYTFDDLAMGEVAVRSNVMVIMAGGLGKRLRPYTENCPKPMLIVRGKPMLEHIIDKARQDGFSNFVISTYYLSNMIEDYFGDGNKWGVSIEYTKEDRPLGTGGGLAYLKSKVKEPIIVTNGDVLTDLSYSDLLDFHVHNSAAATMAIRYYEWQHPFGVVHVKGLEIDSFEEKPILRTCVNAGVYAINPEALQLLEQNEYCDMPTLFERAKSDGKKTIVYLIHEPWLDVGRPDDLLKAKASQ